MIIDFHTHIYPNVALPKPLQVARAQIRKLLSRPANVEHWAQTQLRLVPEVFHRPIEELAIVGIAQRLLVESSFEDHHSAMKESQVDRAVVVAHPPHISNDYVLEITANSKSLIPAFYVAPDQLPKEELRKALDKGVKILKLHPITDGLAPDSTHYLEQLEIAQKEKMIVILHSGVIHSKLIFKKPTLGDISLFKDWFQQYADVHFVLAHMNFHDPETLFESCQAFKNVFTTTSWQPTSTIARAIQVLGDERILFSSDWPLMGNNMAVGRDRIQTGITQNIISSESAEKILGRNAEKLLKTYALA